MASFNIAQLDKQIELLQENPVQGGREFDPAAEHEIQTNKEVVKLVPCRECKRPLVVTTFFAPAKAICRSCTGETEGDRTATVGQPVPGQTDPAKAVNLADCLINLEFANALCPVHPNDEEHEMELKSVTHNDNYGPMELIGYKGNGMPEYRQTAVGETVMHQCKKCNATVNYSTTAVTQFRRQNEPRSNNGKGSNVWASLLGAQEDGS